MEMRLSRSIAAVGLHAAPGNGLFEAGAEGDLFAEGGEDGLAVFAVRGGEQHAVRLEAAHLAGCEVGDDDDVAADQLLGGVPLGDAGEYLPLFVAEVDFEAEQLVSLGDALGDEDAGDAEVDFNEVVDGDLRGVGSGGGFGDGVDGLGDGVHGGVGGDGGDGRLAEFGVSVRGVIDLDVDLGEPGGFGWLGGGL